MALYELHRYLLMTLDPVHIGTGGYRLGRVDNSIAREAGTKLPKIPGTSLHGAIRSYAARIYETPEAAGLNHEKVKNPETNPVYYTFGYIQKSQNSDDKSAKGLSGVVNISDAHILFFPIYSMNGTVWVTTQEKLEEAGFKIKNVVTHSKEEVLYTGNINEKRINLGWLMLNIKDTSAVAVTIEPPKDVKRWDVIKDRIVIVHSSLFSQIVNSNLEVRTSVAIDPTRGAADDGALFTYEALPRATFLTMDVVVDDYRNKFPSLEKLFEWRELPEEERKKLHLPSEKEVKEAIKKKELLEKLGSTPRCVVNAGLNLVEYLGVGGMGTRGFGRIAKVSSWEVANG